MRSVLQVGASCFGRANPIVDRQRCRHTGGALQKRLEEFYSFVSCLFSSTGQGEVPSLSPLLSHSLSLFWVMTFRRLIESGGRLMRYPIRWA